MSVSPENLTAVLLCGGKGERLRPFTENCPKPLVPLLDKPLLQHLVEFLCHQGIRRFVFCVGYKAEMIRDYVDKNLSANGLEIEISDEGEEATIAERIAATVNIVNGPALVCYGDTIANVSIEELCAFHNQHGLDTTVTVFPFRSSFGIVDLSGPHAIGFREKPNLPYHINIGFFIFSGESVRDLAEFDDLTLYLDGLARQSKLTAYPHPGKHLTVNTEKERQSAESEIIELYTL